MKPWSELTWYEMVRRIPPGIVHEDVRDYLSRSTCGTRVDLLGIEDGAHWRFAGGNLGRRFLVRDGVVVEIQTAFRVPDGDVARSVERLGP
jgi:hypothetical protein